MFKRVENIFLTIIFGLFFAFLPFISTQIKDAVVLAQTPSCNTKPETIQFAKDKFSQTLQRQLSPNCSEANYLFTNSKEQLMALVITSAGSANYILTYADGSVDRGTIGQEGVVFNNYLSAPGTTKLNIKQVNSPKPWTGNIIVTLVLH